MYTEILCCSTPHAEYTIRQRLPSGWYIEVIIYCDKIYCDKKVCDGVTETSISYAVHAGSDNVSIKTSYKSVDTIPELLNKLYEYNLPNYAISRDCLPPEVNMYTEIIEDNGDWIYVPLTDAGHIWWSFNNIRSVLDRIANYQAQTRAQAQPRIFAPLPPRAANYGSKKAAKKAVKQAAKKAVKQAAIEASIRDLTAQLNAINRA
jgi:L-rhamnose mutarotase